MTISAIALVAGIVVAIVWGSVLFEVGRREERNIHTIDHFLLYGHDMTADELKWTFYASNISLASIYLALAVGQATQGLVTLWFVVAWVAGLWVFWKLNSSSRRAVGPFSPF